jgi:hypothetical protein
MVQTGLLTFSALGTAAVVTLVWKLARSLWPPRSAHRWRIRLLLATVTMLSVTGPLLAGMLLAAGLPLCGPIEG